MDGLTQTLVEDIAEALEDEYGIVTRYRLEITFGMRIGGNIFELIEIARTGRSANADEDARIERELGAYIDGLMNPAEEEAYEGGLNAYIPGYVLTTDGGYVTAGDELNRLIAMKVPADVAMLTIVDPRYRSTTPTYGTHTETVAAAMRDREEMKHDGPFNTCEACHPNHHG